MSNYTYEFENKSAKLETYEWDNVWWEQTGKTNVPRALYIGDSISCGTRKIATSLSKGEMLFDGFGTSKALHNQYYTEALSLFARQQGEREIILFNNGLHGWHLDDNEQYPELYERVVEFLLKEFKNTPVAIVLTTSVADKEREKRVRLRNRAASEIAERYGLKVIDLYSVSLEYVEYRKEDGVHFTPDGYTKLAERIVSDVKNLLNK